MRGAGGKTAGVLKEHRRALLLATSADAFVLPPGFQLLAKPMLCLWKHTYTNIHKRGPIMAQGAHMWLSSTSGYSLPTRVTTSFHSWLTCTYIHTQRRSTNKLSPKQDVSRAGGSE